MGSSDTNNVSLNNFVDNTYIGMSVPAITPQLTRVLPASKCYPSDGTNWLLYSGNPNVCNSSQALRQETTITTDKCAGATWYTCIDGCDCVDAKQHTWSAVVPNCSDPNRLITYEAYDTVDADDNIVCGGRTCYECVEPCDCSKVGDKYSRSHPHQCSEGYVVDTKYTDDYFSAAYQCYDTPCYKCVPACLPPDVVSLSASDWLLYDDTTPNTVCGSDGNILSLDTLSGDTCSGASFYKCIEPYLGFSPQDLLDETVPIIGHLGLDAPDPCAQLGSIYKSRKPTCTGSQQPDAKPLNRAGQPPRTCYACLSPYPCEFDNLLSKKPSKPQPGYTYVPVVKPASPFGALPSSLPNGKPYCATTCYQKIFTGLPPCKCTGGSKKKSKSAPKASSTPQNCPPGTKRVATTSPKQKKGSSKKKKGKGGKKECQPILCYTCVKECPPPKGPGWQRTIPQECAGGPGRPDAHYQQKWSKKGPKGLGKCEGVWYYKCTDPKDANECDVEAVEGPLSVFRSPYMMETPDHRHWDHFYLASADINTNTCSIEDADTVVAAFGQFINKAAQYMELAEDESKCSEWCMNATHPGGRVITDLEREVENHRKLREYFLAAKERNIQYLEDLKGGVAHIICRYSKKDPENGTKYTHMYHLLLERIIQIQDATSYNCDVCDEQESDNAGFPYMDGIDCECVCACPYGWDSEDNAPPSGVDPCPEGQTLKKKTVDGEEPGQESDIDCDDQVCSKCVDDCGCPEGYTTEKPECETDPDEANTVEKDDCYYDETVTCYKCAKSCDCWFTNPDGTKYRLSENPITCTPPRVPFTKDSEDPNPYSCAPRLCYGCGDPCLCSAPYTATVIEEGTCPQDTVLVTKDSTLPSPCGTQTCYACLPYCRPPGLFVWVLDPSTLECEEILSTTTTSTDTCVGTTWYSCGAACSCEDNLGPIWHNVYTGCVGYQGGVSQTLNCGKAVDTDHSTVCYTCESYCLPEGHPDAVPEKFKDELNDCTDTKGHYIGEFTVLDGFLAGGEACLGTQWFECREKTTECPAGYSETKPAEGCDYAAGEILTDLYDTEYWDYVTHCYKCSPQCSDTLDWITTQEGVVGCIVDAVQTKWAGSRGICWQPDKWECPFTSGCTNPHATNHDYEANYDDGSCITCATQSLCVAWDEGGGEGCSDIGNNQCCDGNCVERGDCHPSYYHGFTPKHGIDGLVYSKCEDAGSHSNCPCGDPVVDCGAGDGECDGYVAVWAKSGTPYNNCADNPDAGDGKEATPGESECIYLGENWCKDGSDPFNGGYYVRKSVVGWDSYYFIDEIDCTDYNPNNPDNDPDYNPDNDPNYDPTTDPNSPDYKPDNHADNKPDNNKGGGGVLQEGKYNCIVTYEWTFSCYDNNDPHWGDWGHGDGTYGPCFSNSEMEKMRPGEAFSMTITHNDWEIHGCSGQGKTKEWGMLPERLRKK